MNYVTMLLCIEVLMDFLKFVFVRVYVLNVVWI